MALTPGLEIPFGVQPVNPVPVDAWSGPYSGSVGNDTEAGAMASANLAIPAAIRFQSMEVRLIYGGKAYKYWYRNGTTDNDLELFASDSGADNYFSSSIAGSFFTTGSVAFVGNETGIFAPQDKGTDVFFYVSGSTDEKSLFGGDVVVSGTLNILQGFSGSLTKLSDGTSYLVAGTGIDIISASNGSITISTAGASTIAGSDTYVQFNDGGSFGGVSGFTFDKNTNTLTVTGGITGSTSYFTNLTVVGTASIAFLETINQQSLIVGDKYITIASGAYDHTTLDGSGILFGSGAQGASLSELGSHAQILYRESDDALEIFPGLKVSGSLRVTENTFLTGSLIVSSSVTANALSGSLTKLNDGSSYLVAGIGIDILSESNGSITVSTNAASTVAGSNTQIQFNDNDSFGASSDLTFDKTSKALTLSGSLFINTGSHNPYDYVIAAYQTVDGDKTADFGFSGLQRNALRITGSLISSTRLAINSEYTSNVTAGTSAQSYNGVIGFRTYAEHESEASTTGQGVTGLESFATVQKPETSSTAGNVNIQRGMNMQLGWGNSRGLNYSGSITNVRGIQVAYLNPSAARTTSTLIGARIGLTNGVFGGAGVTDVYGIDIRPLSGSGVKLGVRTYDPIVIGADNINGLEKLRVSGSSYFDGGAATFVLGLSGSLTNLTDGTSYLVAGAGISITSSSNGSIIITNDGTVGDITAVNAGIGLLGGGTSGDLTIDINDSVVATTSGSTFTGAVNFDQGLSGSLTQLVDGTSAFIAGTGVSISSASNGAVTIATTGASTVAGSDTQVQFNDGGSFGAVSDFTFDKINKELFVSGTILINTASNFDEALSIKQLYTSSLKTSRTAVYVETELTGSNDLNPSGEGTIRGMFVRARNRSKIASPQGVVAMQFTANHTSTSSLYGMYGIRGDASVQLPNDGNTAGHVNFQWGNLATTGFQIAENFTGSIGEAFGYYVSTFGISPSRTINTSRGLYVTDLAAPGVTNAIGVDIDEQIGASTTNLGVRTQSPIVVGTTNVAGTEKLRVNGTSRFDDVGNFILGLSGSLTRLTDGTSAFIAGTGVSISSASNGAVTISSTGASTVAGSNTQIQFNDGGVFGADDGFTYDKLNNKLFVSGSVLVGRETPLFGENLSLNSIVTASSQATKMGAYFNQTVTGHLLPGGNTSNLFGLAVESINRSKNASGRGNTGLLSYAVHQSTSSHEQLWGYLGGGIVRKPLDGNVAGNVDRAVGVYGSLGYLAATNFTGSITDAIGFYYSNSSINADRTVVNSYGVKLTNVGATQGVTNAIGVDIDQIDTASGIKLGLRTQDPIVVGTTNVAGTEKLRVNGTSRFDDVGNFILGLSGSLTRLTDGTSYLVAGEGISIVSGSSGQVTISQNVEWNERLTGATDGVNAAFTLAYPPSDNNSIMVFVNGVLLEYGASNDFTISGNIVTFNDPPPPESKVTATYSR